MTQGNECARFKLKQIEENLQNTQDRLKRQVEEMVQSVTEREGEIMEEVKNVCQKTIEQIKHLATEIENPMKNEEEILNSVMIGEEFQRENDGDFIKCLYYYHELKLMKNKYVTRDHSDAQFSLELRVLSVEKIVELVGIFTSDEHKSSDEDSENFDMNQTLMIKACLINIRNSLQVQELMLLFFCRLRKSSFPGKKIFIICQKQKLLKN